MNLDKISGWMDKEGTKHMQSDRACEALLVDHQPSTRPLIRKFFQDYFTAVSYSEQSETNKTHFYWKHLKEFQHESSAAKAEVSFDSLLAGVDWYHDKHFVHNHVVYFMCSKSTAHRLGDKSKLEHLVLAAFKMEANPCKLTKLSSKKVNLDIDPVVPALLPRALSPPHLQAFSGYFVVSHKRVFAVTEFSEYDRLVMVHCFYKSHILPIGGSNVGIPGVYDLGLGRDHFTTKPSGGVKGHFVYACSPANNAAPGQPQPEEQLTKHTITVSRIVLVY